MLNLLTTYDGSVSHKRWAGDLEGKLLVLSMTGRSDREATAAKTTLGLLTAADAVTGEQALTAAGALGGEQRDVNALLYHLLLSWTAGAAQVVARGSSTDQDGVAAWIRERVRCGPMEGEQLVDVASFKWSGPPEAAWRSFTEKVSGAAGQLPERLLEKWAIEGVGKLGLSSLQESLRMRAPQQWLALVGQVDRYLSVYRETGGAQARTYPTATPTPMDIGAVTTGGDGETHGMPSRAKPSGATRTQAGGPKCYKCGKQGHMSWRCTAGHTPPPHAGKVAGLRCLERGGTGHYARGCATKARREGRIAAIEEDGQGKDAQL